MYIEAFYKTKKNVKIYDSIEKYNRPKWDRKIYYDLLFRKRFAVIKRILIKELIDYILISYKEELV